MVATTKHRYIITENKNNRKILSRKQRYSYIYATDPSSKHRKEEPEGGTIRRLVRCTDNNEEGAN